MAPVLTIFIGGNHEASNYLQELPYGGWVAPNIYYMGKLVDNSNSFPTLLSSGVGVEVPSKCIMMVTAVPHNHLTLLDERF